MAVRFGERTKENKTVRSVEVFVQELGFFLWNNLVLIGLTLFFFYRTFLLGRLNWALLVFLVGLCGLIVCRILMSGRGTANRVAYRVTMLTSVGLLVSALFIQTMRFIFVFLPGLSEPTLSKLLVRAGITTLVLYTFSVTVAFVYYLHAHDMIRRIWNPWIPNLLEAVFDKHNWIQARRSSLIFMRTLVWGGLGTVVMLGVGLVGWLLR